jgi:hypothetical protein
MRGGELHLTPACSRAPQCMLCCCYQPRGRAAARGKAYEYDDGEDGPVAVYARRMADAEAPQLREQPQQAAPQAPSPRYASERMHTHLGEDAPELPPKLAAALGVSPRSAPPAGAYQPPPFAPSYDAAAPPPRAVRCVRRCRQHACCALVLTRGLSMLVLQFRPVFESQSGLSGVPPAEADVRKM